MALKGNVEVSDKTGSSAQFQGVGKGIFTLVLIAEG